MQKKVDPTAIDESPRLHSAAKPGKNVLLSCCTFADKIS